MKSEGDAKGKSSYSPCLHRNEESTNFHKFSHDYLTITKTETAIRMVNLHFRYRFYKIYAPFVRILLC